MRLYYVIRFFKIPLTISFEKRYHSRYKIQVNNSLLSEFLDAMSEVASDGRYRMIKEQIQQKAENGEKEEDVTMWKIEDEIVSKGILYQIGFVILSNSLSYIRLKRYF